MPGRTAICLTKDADAGRGLGEFAGHEEDAHVPGRGRDGLHPASHRSAPRTQRLCLFQHEFQPSLTHAVRRDAGGGVGEIHIGGLSGAAEPIQPAAAASGHSAGGRVRA